MTVKLGIISDIHSNYDALDVVLTALEYEMVDSIICLGDIVGYGPEPEKCVKTAVNACAVILMGNHDAGACGQASPERFNNLALEALEWTKTHMSSQSKKHLASLPMYWEKDGVCAAHGSPAKEKPWEYLVTPRQAEAAFAAFDTQVCFVGHTHRPCIFNMEGQTVTRQLQFKSVELEANKRYIINPGSIGQPRDSNPRAAYGILDTDQHVFTLKRLTYPIASVQQKIKNTRLPWQLGIRLGMGQ